MGNKDSSNNQIDVPQQENASNAAKRITLFLMP